MNWYLLIFSLLLPGALSSSFSRVKRQNSKCVCVPYYQCVDGKVDPYGTGILSERIPIDTDTQECATGVDVCCDIPDDLELDNPPTTSTWKPPPESENRKPPVLPPPVTPPQDGSDILIPARPPGVLGCGIKRLNPLDPRIDSVTRIIGEDSKPENTFYGEYPWMIAVFNLSHDGSKNFVCGGSLIKPDVVLTAAHCVRKAKPGDINVRAGDWDGRNKDEPLPHQDRQVSKMLLHKDFDSGNLRNDIALLYLESPFELNDAVDTICIAKENSFYPENCQASGWGVNSFEDSRLYQPILKKVYLPLVDSATCQAELRKTRLREYFRLHKSFICAGGVVNQDTCTGDGGGPLVCAGYDGTNFRYAQLGIVSWGIGCGDNTPAVYTSVSHFYDWINQHVKF